MKFLVSPLTCPRCTRAITTALQQLDPAADVEVDLAAGTVATRGGFDAVQAMTVMADAGYRATLIDDVPPAARAGTCCGTCTT